MNNYLGYQWQDQVSILASRLTLMLEKEIKLYFLSDARVRAIGKYDKEPKEYMIQGFVLSSGSSHSDKRDQVREMLKDLDCIHLNEDRTYELSFAVCAYPSVMQAYYDMMYEGAIATRLIHKVGGTDAFSRMHVQGKQKELQIIEEEIKSHIVRHTVDK
jgi:hypothetical protein